ncbi:MAG: methyltransferase domain-containing protein [Gammaproteobacteria bacterium]|nr:methyltransferase domain-containing protein [Gammaproteobacteria bacterium]
MSNAVTHDNEYHDSMVRMLELIWGRGYMAPGGPGNVAKILQGTEARGKRILDVGCGIGGPAFEMAHTFDASVVGIDIEAPLIERATAAAKEIGMQDRCRFETVEPGPLPFPDQSFDIVVSSGAITQTSDKISLLGECHRVLVPGGYLSCYEWMKSERDYSDDMRYWFKLEGLTYALETLDELGERFRAAGFVDVNTRDASAWYRAEAKREYQLIKGALYDDLVGLLGKKDADHFVENWRAMVVVCDSGEMRQGYCRGRRFNNVRAA